MTAFNIAAAGAFASIGLVALALGLLARSFSRSALAAGLAGLLGLTGASTWLVRAPASEIISLGHELARKKDQLTKKEVELAGKQAELDMTLAELDAARERAQEPVLGQAVCKPAGDTPKPVPSGLPDRPCLPAPRTDSGNPGVEPDAGKLALAEKERAELVARAKRLEIEVSNLKKQIEDAGLRALRRKLEGIDAAPLYTSASDAAASVAGLPRGAWYVIRLRPKRATLAFSDREFRVSTDDGALGQSIAEFSQEVLAPLAKAGVATRLYMRGSADARNVTGPTKAPAKRELGVLPRLAGGGYAAVPVVRSIPDPIRNEDLPSLRADWLRDEIRTVLDKQQLAPDDIAILENPPAQGADRTAEIVLYVEW